jgi:hypothetical protein
MARNPEAKQLAQDNAHPKAKPSSTTPVRAFSFAGMNGAATSATDATMPMATDAATINPMRRFGVALQASGRLELLVLGGRNHDFLFR